MFAASLRRRKGDIGGRRRRGGGGGGYRNSVATTTMMMRRAAAAGVTTEGFDTASVATAAIQVASCAQHQQKRCYFWGQRLLYEDILTTPRTLPSSLLQRPNLEDEERRRKLLAELAAAEESATAGGGGGDGSTRHAAHGSSRPPRAEEVADRTCSDAATENTVAVEPFPRYLTKGVRNAFIDVTFGSSGGGGTNANDGDAFTAAATGNGSAAMSVRVVLSSTTNARDCVILSTGAAAADGSSGNGPSNPTTPSPAAVVTTQRGVSLEAAFPDAFLSTSTLSSPSSPPSPSGGALRYGPAIPSDGEGKAGVSLVSNDAIASLGFAEPSAAHVAVGLYSVQKANRTAAASASAPSPSGAVTAAIAAPSATATSGSGARPAAAAADVVGQAQREQRRFPKAFADHIKLFLAELLSPTSAADGPTGYGGSIGASPSKQSNKSDTASSASSSSYESIVMRMLKADALTSGIPLRTYLDEEVPAALALLRGGGTVPPPHTNTTTTPSAASVASACGASASGNANSFVVFSSYRSPFVDFIRTLVSVLDGPAEGASGTSATSAITTSCDGSTILWCPSHVATVSALYVVDAVREAVLTYRHRAEEDEGGDKQNSNANANANATAAAHRRLSINVLFGGIPTTDTIMRAVAVATSSPSSTCAASSPTYSGGRGGRLAVTVVGCPDFPHHPSLHWARRFWAGEGDGGSGGKAGAANGMAAMHLRGGAEREEEEGTAAAVDAVCLLPHRSHLLHRRDGGDSNTMMNQNGGDNTTAVTGSGREQWARDALSRALRQYQEGGEGNSSAANTTANAVNDVPAAFAAVAAALCKGFIGRSNGTAPFALRRVYLPKSWLFGPPKTLKELATGNGKQSVDERRAMMAQYEADCAADELIAERVGRGLSSSTTAVSISLPSPIAGSSGSSSSSPSPSSSSSSSSSAYALWEEDPSVQEWARRQALGAYYRAVKGGQIVASSDGSDNNGSGASSSSYASLFLPSLANTIKSDAYAMGHPLDIGGGGGGGGVRMGPLCSKVLVDGLAEAMKVKYTTTTSTSMSAGAPSAPAAPAPFTRLVCGGFKPVLPAKDGLYVMPTVMSVMEPSLLRRGQGAPPAVRNNGAGAGYHPIGLVPKDGPLLLLYPFDDAMLFYPSLPPSLRDAGVMGNGNGDGAIPSAVMAHHAYCRGALFSQI